MVRTVLALGLGLLVAMAGAAGLPAASASHSDGSYDLPVWFTWGQTTLDVLIVPPAHGQIVNGNGALNGLDPFELTPLNSYLDATIDSVNDWRRAIDQFGPAWLRTSLVINVYVVGLDIVPTQALLDPEIVIISDEWKGPILGVAWATNPCMVFNSKFFLTSFTYEDMYNINGQEYGHCLGLEHVTGSHPVLDVMNGAYPHNPGAAGNPKHCMSNLDVKGLERVFGGNFGYPSGGTATMPVSQYATIAC